MENPFEELKRKLELIEDLILDLKKEILIKPKEQSQPKLIKIEDAARLTGYKKGYIYEMVCWNIIPYIKKNRSIRFDRAELEEWMRGKNKPKH